MNDAVAGHDVAKCDVEYMMTHLMRHEGVFHAARQHVKPEHFIHVDEVPYQVIWRVVLQHYENHHALPGFELLSTLAVSAAQNDPGVSDDVCGEISDFLSWAWLEFTAEELSRQDGLAMLERFLTYRHVKHYLDIILATRPVSLPEALAAAKARQAEAASVRQQPEGLAVPTDWSPSDTGPLRPSGVGMLDSRLNGGEAGNEVYVLLGPTGAGKTTLAMQRCCSAAKRQLDEPEPKLHVYVSYEDPLDSLRVRAISFGAKIHKDRLRQLRSYDELSRGGAPLDYERRLFAREASMGERTPCELERLQEARDWMNRYLKLVDFSGRDTGDGVRRGFGYVAEVRTLLDHYREDAGLPIGSVTIDWAGDCIRKAQRGSTGDQASQYYAMLRDFVAIVRDELVYPFGCTGWVLHQLSGEATKKSAYKSMHHSEAEGCRTFAVNAWAAFCMGNKDESTNTCLLAATKTRWAESRSAVVCRIDGHLGELVDVDNQYRVDSSSRRIVLRADADRVAATRPARVGDLRVDMDG